MSKSYAIDRDLQELAKMGDALAKYIPSDTLYMSVSGGFFSASTMPQLTIGAFLMRARRLTHLCQQLTPTQQATLDHAIAQHDDVRKEWAVHYEKKAVREGLSRLKSMTEFFRECRDSLKLCANSYGTEALRRTIVQELLIAMSDYGYDTSEIIAQTRTTDGELRRWITESGFFWDSQLQAIYPRDTFWWLYGQPDAGE
jgi:hypothetical protein